jgi:hypothetical protein
MKDNYLLASSPSRYGGRTMHKRLFLWIGLWAVLLSTYASAQTQQGTIVGSVIRRDGAIVSGAHIEATNTATHQQFLATSGADGSFRLRVPVGHYAIRYYMEGFKAGLAEVDALIGEASSLNLIIPAEQNGQINVHVKDAQGNGAAGIHVSITSGGGDSSQGITDDHGDYVQGGLGGGNYHVVASAGTNPCKRVKIADGQSKSVTLKLTERCH